MKHCHYLHVAWRARWVGRATAAASAALAAAVIVVASHTSRVSRVLGQSHLGSIASRVNRAAASAIQQR